MRKIVLILFILLIIFPVINAQPWQLRRYDATFGIGTTQFYGDLGGYSKGKNLLGLKDFTFRNTRFNISSSLRYRIRENFAARINMAIGLFHSADTHGTNTVRGYESTTTFFEPSLTGEYCFYKNGGENSFLILKNRGQVFESLLTIIDFYGFAGVGGIFYIIKPNDLMAPTLNKTTRFTGVFPIGIGTRMIYSSNISLGIELGGRYPLTDYLDGYTSPYSKSNDIYYFLNFTFTYKIKTGKNRLPSF